MTPFTKWNPDTGLEKPLRWRKDRSVLVAPDLFHKDVPFDFIDRVFAVMVMCPHHTFQVLTKRPERMAEYFASPRLYQRILDKAYQLRFRPEGLGGGISDPADHHFPMPNVWLGTSVEDQEAADERIPHLLESPAVVRFLSCEPLLGPINIRYWVNGGPELNVFDQWEQTFEPLHWVIVGGESGPGARSFNIEWARSIVQQCKAAGVPVFVRQLGARPFENEPSAWPNGFPHGDKSIHLGSDGYGNYTIKGLKDPKGGDPCEWPADLRVREMPYVGVPS